jgi:glycosyltransferase involved in cell wall biosynthesis
MHAALTAIVSQERPDLVHLNGLKPSLARVCAELGVPHVITAHHAGIACAAGTLVRPDGRICAIPMSAGACVSCVNRSRRPTMHGRVLGALPRWLYGPFGRRLNGKARLGYLERGLIYPWLVEQGIDSRRAVLDDPAPMIAPSAYIRDLLLRNGRTPDSVIHVPHGIEPLPRSPLPPVGTRPVRFGYIGRIEPLKGLHVLVEALGSLPARANWELHVFGASRTPWEHDYQVRTLGRAPPQRLRYHGRIEHRLLADAFSAIDVLVVPSLLPEAFGLVVLEAFSAGRPVIVFPSGALPELVRDGVDGVVVRGADTPALAKALTHCIADPGSIVRMAANVPQVRDMRSHVDDLLEVYHRVLRSQVVPDVPASSGAPEASADLAGGHPLNTSGGSFPGDATT